MTTLAGMQSLLDAASPAVLTVYRGDGSVVVSPVWFRATVNELQVVVAAGDAKLDHLRRDPRCILLVFETTPPFRGVEVRGTPILDPEGVTDARREIASRYLGAEPGARFAERRGSTGIVLRLPLADARSWDLGGILPEAVSR